MVVAGRVGRQAYPYRFVSKTQEQEQALVAALPVRPSRAVPWQRLGVPPCLAVSTVRWLMYVRAGSTNAIQWAQDWWGTRTTTARRTATQPSMCRSVQTLASGSHSGGSSDESIALSISEEGFFAFGYINDMTVPTCTGRRWN